LVRHHSRTHGVRSHRTHRWVSFISEACTVLKLIPSLQRMMFTLPRKTHSNKFSGIQSRIRAYVQHVILLYILHFGQCPLEPLWAKWSPKSEKTPTLVKIETSSKSGTPLELSQDLTLMTYQCHHLGRYQLPALCLQAIVRYLPSPPPSHRRKISENLNCESYEQSIQGALWQDTPCSLGSIQRLSR